MLNRVKATAVSEWFTDEQFWEKFYSLMFSDDDFDKAAAQVNDIVELTGLDPDSIQGPVLDLGCGPGRHSLALQAAGFDVTGIDTSTYLLKRAQQNAKSSDVSPEFIHSDMRSFSRPDHYALACCLWSSFGYSETEEDDLTVLKQAFENLKAGGIFLMDVVGKEYAVRNLEDIVARQLDDGGVLIEQPQITHNMCRLENRWMLVQEGTVEQGEWGHWIYSGKELINLVKEAGFIHVEIFGSWDQDSYELDSERLILIAEKP